MNHLQRGFADELFKVAFAGKGLLSLIKRHPIATIGGASVLASTGLGAAAGYRSGLHGAERGRYLQASKHGPSRAARINYHQLFEHKPSERSKKRLHKSYKEETFKR